MSDDHSKCKDIIEELINRIPEDCKNRKGATLYTCPQTFSKLPIYLVGLNPGGKPDEGDSIIDATRNICSYCSQTHWYEEQWGDKTSGEHPIQKRLKDLFNYINEQLGDNHKFSCDFTIGNATYANLVFIRAPNQEKLIELLKNENTPLRKVVEDSLPFHEYVISQIETKNNKMAILSFGFYTYNWIKERWFSGAQKEETRILGVETKLDTLRYFNIFKYNELLNIRVIGFKHPSRFNIDEVTKGAIFNAIREWFFSNTK